MENARITGTVDQFNPGKGFGFIISEDGASLFFVRRNLRPAHDGKRHDLNVGTKVSFLIAAINKVDERGRKMRDTAIDVEAL